MKNLMLAKGVRLFRKCLFWSIPFTTAYLCYDTISRIEDRSIFKDSFPLQMFHVTQIALPYVTDRLFRSSLRDLESRLDPNCDYIEIIKPKMKSTYTKDLVLEEVFSFEGLRHVYQFLTRNNKALIERYTNLLRQHPNSAVLNLSLAELFVKEKDSRKGYIYLKRGLRLLTEVDDELVALCGKIAKEDFYVHAVLRHDPDLKLFYNGFKLVFDEPEDGIAGMKSLVDADPENVRLNLEYAIFLDYLIGAKTNIRKSWLTEREHQWIKCVNLVIRNPDTRFEPLGETQNEVHNIDDEFVLKSNVRRDTLENEMDLAKKIKKLLFENWNKISSPMFFDVVEPRFLSEEPIDAKYVYAMRYDPGKTLMQLIDEHDKRVPEVLMDVVQYMAFLHANLPHGKMIDLKAKTEGRLSMLGSEIPAEVRKLFGEHLVPCYEALDSTNLVFNDDGHPENWIVSDIGNRITRIDLEDRGSIQQPISVVNLFEYCDNEIVRKSVNNGLNEYKTEFEKFSGKKILGDFKFQYLNGVIPRIISLFVAWSDNEKRPKMKNRRKDLVLNAKKSLECIRDEYPEAYNSKLKHYDRLEKAIEETLRIVHENK